MVRLPVLLYALACCLGLPGFATAADVGQSESIAVIPPQGKVGTRFDVVCKNFPEPTGYDTVYIVAAGTPDVDPISPAGAQEKILWKDYAATCQKNQGRFFSQAGPFAPGNYEVRFMTSLYNNDKRQEVATRTAFSVR